ncbi:MAG: M16 family metallopeptidase [Thiobacillaceae bacterium]
MNTISLFKWLAAGILVTAGPAHAAVQEFQLENGLRVLVQEDRRAPVVVSQVWYRTGSMDEFNGTTGVAHLLEHMMFQGTKKVPAGQFSKLIAAAGGRENAFTDRDYTTYFQQLQKDRLELALKLEADRMANLEITDKEYNKEIQVVMEERRMRTDDNPQEIVYEKAMSVAYQEHPYRRPVIGWMDDLEHMTVQDARDWYSRWYAPNNATLVVVGDVKANAVIALAKKYFGPLHAKLLPVRKPQDEPEQRGIKRITVKEPANLPYLLMTWHAPALRDVDRDRIPYALQLLSGILNGQDSARLQKVLVKESKVAVSLEVGYDSLSRGPGMFYLDATPSEGESVDALEKAIRAELANIIANGVSTEELNQAKAQVIASDVYQRDSGFYQAMQIGELASLGLPLRLLDERVDKLRSITADEVKAAAAKILVDDHLTVAVLDPQPIEGNHHRAPLPGGSHVN